MATVTLSRLYAMLAEAIGSYFTGTAVGTHSSQTLQDTSPDGFDGIDAAEVTNKWLRMITTSDSAAPVGEFRLTSSVATTTLTVDTVYSAVINDTDTYELLPYRPDYMKAAIQQAVRQVYPLLYLPLRDTTITVDNLLTNITFEDGATNVFTGWTKTAGTWTEEATIIFEGARSTRGVASGADAQLTQAWQGDVSDVIGATVRVCFHALATAGSTARIGIDFGNSIAVEYSAYHTGNSSGTGIGNWEDIDVTAIIPDEAASLTVILEVEDGGTAYFDWSDGLTVSNAEIYRYTIPTTFENGPALVWQQADKLKPNGDYHPLTPNNHLVQGRFLRFEGQGRLTVPTADTSTVEISESQAELLIAFAARNLFQRLMNADPTHREEHTASRDEWSRAIETLNRSGIRMARMSAHDPRGMWHHEADSSGRYITFSR